VPPGNGRRSVLGAALACLAAFVALATSVVRRWQPLVDADRHLGSRPQEFTTRHDWAQEAWVWIGRLSSGWVAGVMAAVLVTNPLVKQLVGRDRPHWDDPVQVIGSRAFPSGHAANNAAVAGIVIVLVLRWVRRRWLRRTAVATAVLAALVVGADRVFLGVHHCSDVLGGYLLAATVVLLGLAVADPGPPPVDRTAATGPGGTTAEP
jgi:membrane-associated phospholipid phosphatase